MDLLVSHKAGGIAMDETDLVGHAEFHGPALRLFGEQRAQVDAHAGDAVLMSPACASFDMFDNYEHRARVFCGAVAELAEQAGTSLEGSL